jgi:protein-S-isoprenylcysteine O-methyltransferase Ste14
MILQRQQGIRTDRLGRGAKPKYTRNIEILLKIATYSMAVSQIVSIATRDYMNLFVYSEIVRYIGAIIGFLGIYIFISAMVTMKNNWRAGIDSSQKTILTTHGIYKYSRNPAFLGFNLFYIGFTLLFCNLLQLLLLLLCISILHMQILEEEKYLELTFDKEYTDYKKSTARYLLIF